MIYSICVSHIPNPSQEGNWENPNSLNISVTGKSDGSEGLESKGTLDISDGEVYVYAYDDAINAASDISIRGGKVFAYAGNNDGIDSNGTMTISGGLVIASGTGAPESGIDVDSSNKFKINGATFFFSTPDIENGTSYTIKSDGKITDYTTQWNGWYEGGKWTGGSVLATFTSNGQVTTIGSSGNGGNRPGGNGFPGGW